MSHQELTKWIIILTVINVFFGYYLGLCNKDGYNYINFIYLYYIGRYLHLSSRTGFYKILAKYGLLCWIIFSLSEVTLFVFLYHQNLLPDSVRFWSYNSPWVLVTSVCLFMWISLLNLKSNTINILSSSTLGIYIIHTAPPLLKYRNLIGANIYEDYGYIGILLYALIILIICAILALIIIRIKKLLRINE